jgi:HD-GYP domain-containing protein (c-di-GMP phosphodiesterase class II)
MKATTVINTMPYFFSNSQQMGVTYAKKVNTEGVVLALDYTMEQLNNILALQKFDQKSEVFIVDKEGKKFASSAFVNDETHTQTKILAPKLKQVVLEKKIDQIIKYTEEGNHYFVIFKTLFNKNRYLGIKVDSDPLLKPYQDSIQYALLIALILLLLAIPVIFLSTNRIVRPIKALILENSKIKNREFSEVHSIKTHIVEFEELSDSQVSMSKSIQTYQKSQEDILDAIIKLIAEAIDAKSPYTGGHCERVPVIAQLLLDEANRSTLDTFKAFDLSSKDAQREFEIGAWLHDCGKVTTPEYVVDKSTKLETIYIRIHEIRMRFEVLWRDVQIDYLKNNISLEQLHMKQSRLHNDFEFIASVNIGGEFMDASKQERVKTIAKIEWERHFNDRLGLGQIEILRYETREGELYPVKEKLLSDESHHIVIRENFDHEAYRKEGFKLDVPEYLYNYGEVYNLCIEKGTLTPEERYKINEHVIMSIKMLEKIPFPSHLGKIAEYAGTHHETLIGTGYPRKLSKNELSIPARIMAIADIFEALTASDRPYKETKTLSASMKIMSFMVKDQHIDADLFKLFLTSGIYKTYAEKYLKPEQIDEVDIKNYL